VNREFVDYLTWSKPAYLAVDTSDKPWWRSPSMGHRHDSGSYSLSGSWKVKYAVTLDLGVVSGLDLTKLEEFERE
jgi:hypothetical protein